MHYFCFHTVDEEKHYLAQKQQAKTRIDTSDAPLINFNLLIFFRAIMQPARV